MFFSLSYFYLFVIIHTFGLQNYSYFFKQQRVERFLAAFFSFFYTFPPY
ncbi:hypothetical protein HMPREF0673_00717 [Leyella stercorea DSM 18206]|uniref:Uncharacterized protein n=1 Tax=Leyella stercorea DSM 18206 TaxID=1002367 RepID=G6AVS6_9BACT|nr:hypothetical protein HMPREF0673_00717 [Leyella stercorea DSM 18206]